MQKATVLTTHKVVDNRIYGTVKIKQETRNPENAEEWHPIRL